MAEPLLLRNVAWAVTTALEFVLLISVVRHKMYRSHPLFSIYVLSIIAQSALAFGVYRQWGFFSYAAWDIAWGSQGIVLLIRVLAVWEVTRRLLSAYSGVWGLVSKILL